MINFDLKDKVAILSGGSTGLGLDMARALAEYGASLAIIARNVEKLRSAQEYLKTVGNGDVRIYQCDVSDLPLMRSTVQQILGDFGRIDILVNNAGVITASNGPENMTEEQWDSVINVDLRAVFFMCQEVYNRYMKDHGGKIVNICSVSGLRASADSVSYSVAKAGALQLTKCLAIAWAKDGVFVNAISPGQTALGMAKYAVQDKVKELGRRVPQKCLGEEDCLNGALLFLASDANTYCQGQNIVCDGGLILPLVQKGD